MCIDHFTGVSVFKVMTSKEMYLIIYDVYGLRLTGMNVNIRELNQHVVYEPESYYAAFSAELEICASIMWSLVAHLNDKVGSLCGPWSLI